MANCVDVNKYALAAVVVVVVVECAYPISQLAYNVANHIDMHSIVVHGHAVDGNSIKCRTVR